MKILMGIYKHTNKKHLLIAAFFVITTAVQLGSPLMASALLDPSGGGAASKVDQMGLDDQIRTYKMYYALGVCMNHYAHTISPSDAANGNWFSDGKTVNVGSLVDTSFGDGADGQVGCNNIAQAATTLWGIPLRTKFLQDAGWTVNTDPLRCLNTNPNLCPPPGPGTYSPPSKNPDLRLQQAIQSQLLYSPAYPSYFGYFDNFSTFTGICGAKFISAGKLTPDAAALGYVQIYTPDFDTQASAPQVYSFDATKNKSFGAAAGLVSEYGYRVDPNGYAYDDATVSCGAIEKNLSSAQALGYVNALPPPLQTSGAISTLGNPNGDNTTSCGLTGVGWMVCPLMTFLGKLDDQAFSVLGDFLDVNSKLVTDSNLVTTWGTFRNIANILFVIAFLIVIYSQITGFGISNYGIKKILPRIIAVAILVNLSLIFCQIAVDLSNVIGSSVYNLFTGIVPHIGGYGGYKPPETWEKVIGTLLEGAVGVGLLVAIFLAPMALLAVAMAIMLLIARKAIIVLLVVISPLAFVAFLLPNTAGLFKKWWKVFSSLLLLYPIIGVIFGGSSLAAQIVATPGVSASGADIWIMPLTALGIMALPLFLVPTTLKNAFSSLGSVGGKLAALQDRANKRSLNTIKESRLGDMKAKHDKNKFLNKMRSRSGEGRMTRLSKNRLINNRVMKKTGLGGALEKYDVSKVGASLDNSGVGRRLGLDRGAANAAEKVAEAYGNDIKGDTSRMMIENTHEDRLKGALTGEIAIRDSEKNLTGRTRKLSYTELDALVKYTMEKANAMERQELSTHMYDEGWATDHRNSLDQGMRAKNETGIHGSGTLGAMGTGDLIKPSELAGKTNEEKRAMVQEKDFGEIAKRAAAGTLDIEGSLRDGHTMKYVREALIKPHAGVKPEVSEAGRQKFREAIEDMKTKNPQAWERVSREVKDMIDGKDEAALDDSGRVILDDKGRHIIDPFDNEGKSIGTVPPSTP